MSLSDPNIQAIPRDFEIEMPSAIGESPPLGVDPSTVASYHTRTGTRHRQGPVRQGRGAARMAQEGVEPAPSCAVSVRHAFCPFQGEKGFRKFAVKISFLLLGSFSPGKLTQSP